MGKSTWYNYPLEEDWFKKAMGTAFEGTPQEIQTKEVKDPHKIAVSTPMSKYLASEIGKGLPQYKDPTGMGDTSSFTDFLGMEAGDWFDKAVGDPETKRFKEEMLPEIREGYAGALRGSGRYRAEEAGITQFSEGLAQQRAVAEVEIPAQQFQMRSQIYERDYKEWMTSLPQMNPVLGQAMQYLQESTSTGTTILSALDPGKKGWFWDLLKAGAQIATAMA